MSDYRRMLMMAYAANKRNVIIYPGLVAAWDILKEGKNNDHPDREWSRDLTGNGHDIQWQNVAFSEMSGYNGYIGNFNNWRLFNNNDTYYQTQIINSEKFKCRIGGGGGYALIYSKPQEYPYEKLKFKVTGITNVCTMNFGFGGTYYFENRIEEDGIYEIDIKTFAIEQNRINDVGFEFFSPKGDSIIEDANIFVEIIPEYEGAICLDGLDDRGVCNNMPILEDYTLIVKRNTFTSDDSAKWTTTACFGNNTSNVYELANKIAARVYVDGKLNGNIWNAYTKDGISFTTKSLYNGLIPLSKGETPTNNNSFYIGALNGNTYFFKGVFYSAYLFDRSLDEQEIKAFIRKYIDYEYLLPSEIPTPDCYYNFGQGSNEDENRETITDYSGNNNHAKAYNIGWSGMSGYGGYSGDFTKSSFQSTKDESFEYVKPNKLHYINIMNVGGDIWNIKFSSNKIKLMVTGSNEKKLLFGNFGTFGWKTLVDGLNEIEIDPSQGYIFKSNSLGECDITIELLPEYEGALVLDGVDDHIKLEAFDSGFKTVFMVCNPFVLDKVFYGHRRFSSYQNYCIYNQSGNIAYTKMLDANYSKVYINNKTNTTLKTDDLRNKKHLININYSGEIPNLSILSKIKCPIIGQDSATLNDGENFYMNMAIYKFLGFKEELTEEQIQYVIEKYNLLDGVDDIEVS